MCFVTVYLYSKVLNLYFVPCYGTNHCTIWRATSKRTRNIMKNYFGGVNLLKINVKMDFKDRANGQRSSGSKLCIVPCAFGQSGLSWIY